MPRPVCCLCFCFKTSNIMKQKQNNRLIDVAFITSQENSLVAFAGRSMCLEDAEWKLLKQRNYTFDRHFRSTLPEIFLVLLIVPFKLIIADGPSSSCNTDESGGRCVFTVFLFWAHTCWADQIQVSVLVIVPAIFVSSQIYKWCCFLNAQNSGITNALQLYHELFRVFTEKSNKHTNLWLLLIDAQAEHARWQNTIRLLMWEGVRRCVCVCTHYI